eukprot:553530_1
MSARLLLSTLWATTEFNTQLTFVTDLHKESDTLVNLLSKPQQYINNGALKQVQTTIYDLSQPETHPPMTFETNGFEYYSPPDTYPGKSSFMRLLSKRAAIVPGSYLSYNYPKHVQQLLIEWSKTKPDLKQHNVYCYLSQYRNSFGLARPLNIVHIDFPFEKFVNQTLKTVSEIQNLGKLFWPAWLWRNITIDFFQFVYPKVTRNEFDALKFKFKTAVNVWIPLVKLRSHPLVLMDTKTFNTQDIKIIKQGNGLDVDVIGVKYDAIHSSKQRWYWKSNMQKGEVIILDTLNTPHSSAKI